MLDFKIKVPLKRNDYFIEITDNIAKIAVTQIYFNEGE